MQLTIEAATDIHDCHIARAWVGRDASGAWQCVIIEWGDEVKAIQSKMKAVASSPYAGFCTQNSALTPEQARAAYEVLRFKLETGEEIAGVTLEV